MATFTDIYKGLPSKGNIETPKRAFVRKIADETKKTEKTVRAWIYGDQTPDELTKSVLATYFNCKPEDLFPPKN
jgi:predicted transcriptional regulator